MTSFNQTLEYFFNTEVDMFEAAMWWEMPEPDAWAFPSFGADGIFRIREDLGGAVALAEGIRRVQATGRRVQLYVSGDIAHRGSSLFNETWPASRWAQWWGANGPDQANPNDGDGYKWNATYMCHALPSWQEVVAGAVARTITATNCDGVRLDGLGNFHHAPCLNPAHAHAHPYTNQGLEADLAIMSAVRAAMDALPGGKDKLLSTEGFADHYNFYAGSALVSWVGYPAGNEMSVSRVTQPWYVGNVYGGAGTDLGRIVMDGWNQWSVPPRSPESGWNMLRETFAAAFAHGAATAIDPIITNGTHVVGLGLRMYDAGAYYSKTCVAVRLRVVECCFQHRVLQRPSMIQYVHGMNATPTTTRYLIHNRRSTLRVMCV
jgi:hypothetical protein